MNSECEHQEGIQITPIGLTMATHIAQPVLPLRAGAESRQRQATCRPIYRVRVQIIRIQFELLCCQLVASRSNICLQYLLEPRSVLEMMQSRDALQDVTGHQTLRQNHGNTEQVIQISLAVRRNVEAVSGMQMRELMGRIQKIEAEMEERLQSILKEDKLHAQLSAALQELSELIVDAAKRFEGNELDDELNKLQGQSDVIRRVFENSRDKFTKIVEQMKTMKMSLVAMMKQVDKLHEEAQKAEMRAHGLATMVPGMAQAQVAQPGMDPYGRTYNNLPASYQQTQASQSGVAQNPAVSAVVCPYAYPYGYFPPAAYQQATQGWSYAYPVPYAYANPMASHQAVQASGYAYPGSGPVQNATPYYPGYLAGYDQNALHYPSYVAPRHPYPMTVNGTPTTDATNMEGNAGFPAGQVQTSGRAGTGIGHAPIPPSESSNKRQRGSSDVM
ncbi:uncharacterized protein LOC100831442 isoform X2 [Brachypodium distachyon]|uniref:uncharacterized protein LOC100831442 isoform X2 n=1 Tax=Brachypodium distachyon TaxID=15368 RepID=UPI00052FECC9|nr:uncharacterized protein LOC100831442 isoform X2 [Brachypodium distachyon]|eukprot:XP_014757208.1 uncharacterized protein LOC100831442 isoform X2 [Brachypodium distachyon]